MKKAEIYKVGRNSRLESKKIEQILLKITGLSKSQLFLLDEINDNYLDIIKKSFKRLKNGEPIEYITNNAEFYSLNFYVDERVLIPRDDTEIIVDKTIETIINSHQPSPFHGKEIEQKITLIDVGTGSSCIPISILKNTSRINNCYVIDISKNALEVSKKNINKYKLDKKIKQIHGDLIKNFIGNNDFELNKNIIITANLPYIKNEDYENIDKETIKFEPALALYGGKDTGFELYEQLIKESTQLKTLHKLDSLILLIEIGFDQKEYSEKYLKNLNLKFKIFKDNGGIDRSIKIEF